MKKFRKLTALLMLLGVMFVVSAPAFAAGEDAVATEAVAAEAEDGAVSNTAGMKAVGAAICVGFAAGLGALGMGLATGKAAESMARQPEIRGDIRTNLILGIVFMETAIIYALVIAVLIIFVL